VYVKKRIIIRHMLCDAAQRLFVEPRPAKEYL
jgi:hypothetical protein